MKAFEKQDASFDNLVEDKRKKILKNHPNAKNMSEEKLALLADTEVIADACETMLKDSKIFEDIAQGNPSLAQKIKNALRNFINRLKEMLGSMKALTTEGAILEKCVDDLEQIQNLWDKAVTSGIKTLNATKSEQKNNTAVDSDAKYSIRYTKENKPVVVVEENILQGIPKKQWVKTVKNVMSEKFSDGIPVKGRFIKVNRISRNEYTNSKNTKYLRDTKGNIYVDKLKTANNLDEIILASTNYINEDLKHKRKDGFKEFARGEVLLQIGENEYKSNVIIGYNSANEMVLYDIIDFIPAKFALKKESTPYGRKPIRNGMLSNDNIPQTNGNVNIQSMQENKNMCLKIYNIIDFITFCAYNKNDIRNL